ncbi:hypothetical protein [Pseudobacteriovorax antillogorgiicola]|uniref:Lipoprotein n=1 Tax=Pseudobacteriovorax antillogorgiicola TaxID=1513793 RepID=A0A1Y6B849_9BACT|nr:hypothetical protein [Pseudobacteriovorax antillogorgiicola]TCS58741.1 hypothetical protein EDD56_102255 [Pseudobacteriovorax antillogorgiicola]SME95240.1 hypothetical protein SAMN06296036_102188 [Pseudobacteriovorax antillogorgiicola]
MKMFLRRFISVSGSNSLRFGAKSALIATSLLSACRVFAGNSPSSGVLHKESQLSQEQLMLIESLLVEKLKSPDVSEVDRIKIDEALIKVEQKYELFELKEER